MKPLLFLTHRIPYPPNKGDKIRSFHLLKHLARDYRIYLGTFIDDPLDWAYLDEVRALCAETHCLGIDPRWAKVRSLAGLARGEALTLAYYRRQGMQTWVDEVLSRPEVDRVLVFSGAMAQYLTRPLSRSLHRVIDFVDVDSEKWRQYGESRTGPMSWLYCREGRLLGRYERTVAAQFDASLFVSAEEATLFRRLVPEVAGRTFYLSNGVDADYFDPDRAYPNPYRDGDRVLVFTGAMDYWANVDAVGWFAHEVFSLVRESVPKARFYIVGARPTEAVRRLARLPGVHVTGAIRDIRPYLAHAWAAVAPLRIARGLQNKVLEAMAMAKPVLATHAAMEGIQASSLFGALMADQAEPLARKAVDLLLHGDRVNLGMQGRRHVLENHDWTMNLRRIEELLEGGAPRQTPSPALPLAKGRYSVSPLPERGEG